MMEMNSQLKQKVAYSSTTPVNVDESTQDESVQFSELWPTIRAILLVWAVAVWALLVMMPGVQMISDITTAMIHLPHVFIGLGLIGAMFSAYSLRSDGHLLWFLGVLLLLAGWM